MQLIVWGRDGLLPFLLTLHMCLVVSAIPPTNPSHSHGNPYFLSHGSDQYLSDPTASGDKSGSGKVSDEEFWASFYGYDLEVSPQPNLASLPGPSKSHDSYDFLGYAVERGTGTHPADTHGATISYNSGISANTPPSLPTQNQATKRSADEHNSSAPKRTKADQSSMIIPTVPAALVAVPQSFIDMIDTQRTKDMTFQKFVLQIYQLLWNAQQKPIDDPYIPERLIEHHNAYSNRFSQNVHPTWNNFIEPISVYFTLVQDLYKPCHMVLSPSYIVQGIQGSYFFETKSGSAKICNANNGKRRK
ncbi:hypothetical protein CXG81DRAFT_21505 [Caulochytrium protostelioides]|uniref:EF-hand domain-containing protein n=1 Tax=Caulochytrium protostelioides TaxID=1555241 RepID=A0A4P9X053_9FUNG|nr:hypothetical protein CXG81DRAFT_21505 [Caulochytrium protostelioides]|eukprot:RKO98245.1 hypothetical protein CXG81DRAFT_21505 [Caulochytrium protostelioides]